MRASEGDPEARIGGRGTCLKCGYILVELANGGIICARCRHKPPRCNKCGGVLTRAAGSIGGLEVCERCHDSTKCQKCGGGLTPISSALPGLGYCKKCNGPGKPSGG